MRFAEIIKARVTSREVIEALGMRVGRGGMAKCPFHGDKDASLKVYSDPRRGWYCYGCNTGGDAIDFVMRFNGLSYNEAIAWINEAFSLGLALDRKMTPEERRALNADIERKKRERAAKKAACDAAETAYFAAFEAWLRNESTIAEEAPRGPFDAMSEAFIDAVKHSAEIRDTLNMAEERWWQARAAG